MNTRSKSMNATPPAVNFRESITSELCTCVLCNNFRLFSLALSATAELRLPPKPTTTVAPYIPPTAKQPRRKQHHQNHGKGAHDSTGKNGANGGNGFSRDSYIINHIQENDLLGGFASDGKFWREERRFGS